MIVCIGWGSLVWDPGMLRCVDVWKTDGPKLPVEFARTSRDGRLTLVLTPGVQPVPTLWTVLDYDSPEEARSALADRESSQIHAIGLWPKAALRYSLGAETIHEWAADRRLDAVVWTALRPKFGGKNGVAPDSPAAAISYLRGLDPKTLSKALKYIREAPAQVNTGFRAALEAEFENEPHIHF